MSLHISFLFLSLVLSVQSQILLSGSLQREAVVTTQVAAVCNDGTDPVYYKRTNSNSTVWLIYLEGGGFCFDADSCEERYQLSQYSVSGSFSVMPLTLNQAGLLSNDCAVNPHFCSANIFYLHYCSSDFWLGSQNHPGETMAYFKGKVIFQEMISQIFTKYPLIAYASEIALAGAAAGGIGVLGLADQMKEILQTRMLVSRYRYFGIADSGWYLKGNSLVEYTCSPSQCNLQESVQKAYSYLNLQFDESCQDRFLQDWRCAFLEEYSVAYSIETPILSTFYLEDTLQLWSDGVNTTKVKRFTEDELNWAKSRASQTKSAADYIRTYLPRHGFYIIDCLHHVVTTQDLQISRLEIDSTSLNDALESWIKGEPLELIETDCTSTIACNPYCTANQELNTS